mmetsp:Transcript_37561/g.123956  ORF Transcript_37561/g.123956 Transcript_37561/m.123956 type:complete len:255 (+) Transcript_37561:613-1377(+)
MAHVHSRARHGASLGARLTLRRRLALLRRLVGAPPPLRRARSPQQADQRQGGPLTLQRPAPLPPPQREAEQPLSVRARAVSAALQVPRALSLAFSPHAAPVHPLVAVAVLLLLRLLAGRVCERPLCRACARDNRQGALLRHPRGVHDRYALLAHPCSHRALLVRLRGGSEQQVCGRVCTWVSSRRSLQPAAGRQYLVAQIGELVLGALPAGKRNHAATQRGLGRREERRRSSHGRYIDVALRRRGRCWGLHGIE